MVSRPSDGPYVTSLASVFQDPQRDCYVDVLRDAMAVDSLDSCGIYFGTTGGQVYASADAGDTWEAIAEYLPRVSSVEVQTLP